MTKKDSPRTEEELSDPNESAPIKEAEAVLEPESETETQSSGEDNAGELLKRLDEAEEAARVSEDKYLRVTAELENYRRRVAREREELREYAIASVLEDLLPALDNLQLGLKAADQHPEAKVVSDGFRMVATQIKRTLEEYGLTELSPTGQEFDPNLHDCMTHQPHEDVAENFVIETTRAGYKLKNRLLRPASVIVSSGTGKEDSQ